MMHPILTTLFQGAIILSVATIGSIVIRDLLRDH